MKVIRFDGALVVLVTVAKTKKIENRNVSFDSFELELWESINIFVVIKLFDSLRYVYDH